MLQFLPYAFIGAIATFWAALWLTVQYQMGSAAELGYAMLFSMIGVVVGGAVYWVAKRLTHDSGLCPFSATISFFAVGYLWWTVLPLPANLDTDGQQLGFMAGLLVTTPAVAIVGAIFGAGVGQRRR